MQNIPVLIVGSGPVGLSLALALARQDIPSIIIERNPGLTTHPRARGVNVRTMELFRQWGNYIELMKYEQPKEARRIIWAETFQGREITRVSMDASSSDKYSPAEASLVSQDRVEEFLYNALLSYQLAEVHFLKEYISFQEDNTGITVQVVNKQTNQVEYFRCQYLVAADGAHSEIRSQLGIIMEGPANLGKFCSVYCEIDISAWTKHRPCIGYFFTDPSLSGRFLASVDGADRWIIGLRFTEEFTKETYTDAYCIREIQRITNLPDLDVKIINKNFWTMAAQIANQYRKGRIFLVGDAAHRLPPTGGFGMNTGIQDAHNLAWKLAFVIKYNMSDKLLDTYYIERMPVAKQNIDWSTENAKRYTKIYEAIRIGDVETLKDQLHDQQQNLNYSGLDLGFIYYLNTSIINSESKQTLSINPSVYMPTTHPGSRAPHVNLIRNEVLISTLDLFDREFVLLIGSEGEGWQQMANELSQSLAYPLKVYKISNDGDLIDPKGVWHNIYEITTEGAVLVRPDGHVTWRRKGICDGYKDELAQILKSIEIN